MKEPVVVDSTCLIGLENIGHLDLLPHLFEPVHAPPEVEREFGSSPEWLKIEKPPNSALVKALLPWIKPLLNKLSEKGFHLSETLKQEALHLAGE